MVKILVITTPTIQQISEITIYLDDKLNFTNKLSLVKYINNELKKYLSWEFDLSDLNLILQFNSYKFKSSICGYVIDLKNSVSLSDLSNEESEDDGDTLERLNVELEDISNDIHTFYQSKALNDDEGEEMYYHGDSIPDPNVTLRRLNTELEDISKDIHSFYQSKISL
jgi:hypothetical protein